jgi:hypothetical protein
VLEQQSSRPAFDDVVADELIERSAVEPVLSTVDIRALWRSLIDVESEQTTEGAALAESFYDRETKRHVVPFENGEWNI